MMFWMNRPKVAYKVNCPFCKGVAFYAAKAISFLKKTCRNCGKVIICEASKYIDLTVKEAQDVTNAYVSQILRSSS